MLGGWTLALLTVAYLGSLFVLAALVDRGVGRSLSRHPAVTVLSLGVYSTAWTFFASVGFAATDGWRAISTQIGAVLSFALMPLVWVPLARVVKARQLSSLADLFAYRYQSRSAAGLVTGLLLISSLPYQAHQLHAVVEMVAQLGGAGARGAIAAATTAVLVLFGVMYGVRHLTPRERHDGLVAAVAFESLVKLVAHVAIAGFVLIGVFGGMRGLDGWLATHPEAQAALNTPARESSWAALMLIAAAGVFLMPRQWHMAFTEGDERGLRAASFGLPAYSLILNLSVPLVLFAGWKLGLSGPADFYVLGLVQHSGSPLFGGVVFLGGLSAATAMIIVTTVALAGMVQHHLVLPLTGVAAGPGELYPRLRWVRRGLIAGIILLGYGVYLIARTPSRLVDLGIVAFVAVVQFVPGLVGVLVWPRATARGLIAGLVAGSACWIAVPLIPILAGRGTLPIDTGTDIWTFSVVLSLGVNGLAFVWGSLRREPTAAEQYAAEVCRRRIDPPAAGLVDLGSAAEFVTHLAPVLGADAAQQEVDRALADLGLNIGESRPEQLRALRDGLERNLTGLLGPMMARFIIEKQLAVDTEWRSLFFAQLRHVEDLVAAARPGVDTHAVMAQLDLVQRYLRSLLEEIPLGVCALGSDGRIIVWNRALERLTGISAGAATNHPASVLSEPWASLLLLGGPPIEGEQRSVSVLGEMRSLRVHRTPLDGAFLGARPLKAHRDGAPEQTGESIGELYLLEDHTEKLALAERLAHAERRVELGMMSGVLAHEINNPLTALKLSAQLLVEKLPEGSSPRADADGVVEEAVRLQRLIESLLDFVRTGQIARTSVDPAELVRAAAEDAAPNAMLDLAAAPAAWLLDEMRMRQVLENLLRNAEQASPGEVQAIVGIEKGELVITVRDAGPGFAEGEVQKIFKPYYTTKTRGVGLGLAVAQWVVEMHGGVIDARNRSEGGAELRVAIPPR